MTFPPSTWHSAQSLIRRAEGVNSCRLAEGVSLEKLRENTIAALRAASAPPEIRTGMIVVGDLPTYRVVCG